MRGKKAKALRKQATREVMASPRKVAAGDEQAAVNISGTIRNNPHSWRAIYQRLKRSVKRGK